MEIKENPGAWIPTPRERKWSHDQLQGLRESLAATNSQIAKKEAELKRWQREGRSEKVYEARQSLTKLQAARANLLRNLAPYSNGATPSTRSSQRVPSMAELRRQVTDFQLSIAKAQLEAFERITGTSYSRRWRQ